MINHHAEIVAFKLTIGNSDDRKLVPEVIEEMKRKVFADRGSISEKLTHILMQKGMHLFTKVKKMKNQWNTLVDKLMLKKRAMIESVNHLLKSSCQIEHHPHRSRWKFQSNLMADLANYCLNPSKPHLFFSKTEIEAA